MKTIMISNIPGFIKFDKELRLEFYQRIMDNKLELDMRAYIKKWLNEQVANGVIVSWDGLEVELNILTGYCRIDGSANLF